MEAFKSEQKRLAATANHRDKEKITKEKEAEERKQREKAETDDRERQQVKQEDEKREKELDELERLVLQQARRQGIVPEITSFPTIEVVTVTAPSSTSPSASTAANNTTADTLLADQNKTTTSTSSSSRVATPRSDSSESIYAHIIRRLNALEGNSSLVARYIEEQAKVMRHMLSRVEKGWDDWQVERELDELSRWEQEVSSIPRSWRFSLMFSVCAKKTDLVKLSHKWNFNVWPWILREEQYYRNYAYFQVN